MDLQAEKIELIKLIAETDSEEIIDQIKAVFRGDGHDFYDELPQHVKNSINRGLKDFEEGNVFDHDTVMKEMNIKYGLKS